MSKRNEEILKKALSPELGLQLFRNLLETTTDAIYFKDLDSRFIRMSERQARSFGLKHADEGIGCDDTDFFTAEHSQQARHDEQLIIQTGMPLTDKEEMETWPDGRVTWVSTSKMPLRDDHGRIIGTFGISRDITARKLAEEALRKSEERLRLALEAMERELDRARQIQRALLPLEAPEQPLLDIAFHYEPLEAIGGDYYSVQPINANMSQLGVFVGDVMGHGVSAALFMALLKFLTDQLFEECGLDPRQYLERLNRTLMHQMPMSFATGIYGTFSGHIPGEPIHLQLAGAGHPFPLLWRRATGRVENVQLKGNAALGLTEMFSTESIDLTLESGDMLLLYTDGVTESSNDADEMFGAERLADLLCRTAQPNAARTLEDIMSGVHEFRGDSPLDDDVLLIGFRVK